MMKRENQRGSLLRVLGLAFGLAVTLGGTIGAGIMRTPGEIAAKLPHPWLIVGAWVAGGVYSLLGAFSMSELGAMIPRSGGNYVFAKRAFGNYVAFVVGWTDWLGLCGSTAAVTILIGEYTEDVVPLVTGHVVLAGSIALVVLATLQWQGIRWGSRFQNVTSATTAIVFFGLIVGAFALPRVSAVAAPSRTQPAMSLSPFIVAVIVLQAVIYTYDGWYSIIYFGDEIRNPARDVPRAMIGGVALLTTIYVLLNASLLRVLPVSSIAGQDLAAGTLTRSLFGRYGDVCIRAVMILTLLSLTNVNLLCASRVLYAMSRDGLGSRTVVIVNSGGTPVVALLLTTVASLAFIASGSFEKVIAVTAFFFVAKYTMSYLALFWLRRQEPDSLRPYRAWGHPWTTAAALVGSVAFVSSAIAGDTRNSMYAVAVILACYPLYKLASLGPGR
jgi:APA family basic amino acid/polyamine antiporter